MHSFSVLVCFCKYYSKDYTIVSSARVFISCLFACCFKCVFFLSDYVSLLEIVSIRSENVCCVLCVVVGVIVGEESVCCGTQLASNMKGSPKLRFCRTLHHCDPI